MVDKEDQPAGGGVTPHSLVTQQHVAAALRADKGPHAHLTSFTIHDFTKQGDNFACVVSSVKVKFSLHQQSAEVVYIVKLNPCRKMKEMQEFVPIIFHKEIDFYLNILPELDSALTKAGVRPLRLPKCFHGSEEKDKEIIFLEDLRPQGFQMFDRRRGLDAAHATLVLQELARLHAASRLLQAAAPHTPLTSRHPSLARDVFTELADTSSTFDNVIAHPIQMSIDILKRVGGYENCMKWLDDLQPVITDRVKELLSASKFKVVCHGDCWNNNLLFRYNEIGAPVEVRLLDLQVNRYASPATDLNYLLYTSLTGEVRKPNLAAFLTSYHSSFCAVMEAAGEDMIFSPRELLQEFRDKNVLGVLFGSMAVTGILVEPEDVPDLSGEANFETMMKEFEELSLKQLATNPLMRPRFLSIFDEMMETGLIPK